MKKILYVLLLFSVGYPAPFFLETWEGTGSDNSYNTSNVNGVMNTDRTYPATHGLDSRNVGYQYFSMQYDDGDGANNYAYLNVGTIGDWWSTFAVYVDSTSLTDAGVNDYFRMLFYGQGTSSTVLQFTLRNNSDDYFFQCLYRADGSSGTESGLYDMELDRWYWISIKYSRTDNEMWWQVWDSTGTSMEYADTNTWSAEDRNLTDFVIGHSTGSNGSDAGYLVYIDHIQIDSIVSPGFAPAFNEQKSVEYTYKTGRNTFLQDYPIIVDLDSGGAFGSEVHWSRGMRTIAELNGVTVTTTPMGLSNENLYRSASYPPGQNFYLFMSGYMPSGCLVGNKADSSFYYFGRDDDSVKCTKWYYLEDNDPEDTGTTVIYSHPDLSEETYSVYYYMVAAADGLGNVHVVYRYGDPDTIMYQGTYDHGETWTEPVSIIDMGTDMHYNCQIDCNDSNWIFVGSEIFGTSPWFLSISKDSGQTWETDTLFDGDNFRNTKFVLKGTNEIHVFQQDYAYKGLRHNWSTNLGQSWEGWTNFEPTCDYGDPSPVLDSSGDFFYIGARCTVGVVLTGEEASCGDMMRACVLKYEPGVDSAEHLKQYNDYLRTAVQTNVIGGYYAGSAPVQYSWWQLYIVDGDTNNYTFYDYIPDAYIISAAATTGSPFIPDSTKKYKFWAEQFRKEPYYNDAYKDKIYK